MEFISTESCANMQLACRGIGADQEKLVSLDHCEFNIIISILNFGRERPPSRPAHKTKMADKLLSQLMQLCNTAHAVLLGFF